MSVGPFPSSLSRARGTYHGIGLEIAKKKVTDSCFQTHTSSPWQLSFPSSSPSFSRARRRAITRKKRRSEETRREKVRNDRRIPDKMWTLTACRSFSLELWFLFFFSFQSSFLFFLPSSLARARKEGKRSQRLKPMCLLPGL